MSELIDRIFDAEKISAEVNTILAELAKTATGIGVLKKSIEDLMATTRKAKGTDELIANTKLLNDTVVKGGVEMKRWEAETEKLRQKTDQLTVSEKQAAIEIAKARIELQAAQKATKDAALAQIVLEAETKGLAKNYDSLKMELSATEKAFKNLTLEEQKSAKGKELMTKYNELKKITDATDESFGHFQHNVGKYASALDGLTPQIGGVAGKILEIARAARENKKSMDDMDTSNKMGLQTIGSAPSGLSTMIAGFKGLTSVVFEVGKAFLANPIGLVVAGLVSAFALLKSAMDSNGEATEKLQQVLAPFKILVGSIMQGFGKLVSAFLDGALAVINFGNSVMSVIPFLEKTAKKNTEAIALEREKQKLLKEGIVDKAADAKEELRLAELRKNINDKQNFSAKERLAMAREIDKSEKALALDDATRANNNLKVFIKTMAAKGKSQKDYTIDELKQLADLQAAKYNEQQAYFDKTKKLAGKESALVAELDADKKAAAEAEKNRNEKTIEARRRLSDSSLALMKEGKDKQIAISNETYNRQIEDLQRNGELTGALAKNLKQKQAAELKKIEDEWTSKNLQDKIKSDELVLENMKKSGSDTLEFEKKLLNERKEAEILAGSDREEVNKKYRFLELDLIAKNADERVVLFQKEIEKRAELASQGYAQQELDLKKQFSKGIISRKEYEARLIDLKSNALKKSNDATISALEKELNTQGISDDKRAELSNKLTALRIANENAVTDATIKAGEDQAAADKDAINKRIQIAQELSSETIEVLGAIGDFANQQSENKIAALEAEQEANDEKFSKDQEQLDKGLMSDETRAAKQKELDDKKAASDKVIQDKIKAEKVKQAKWDKAMALTQAISSTAIAVMKVFAQSGIFGFITAGLVAAAGAIQVATIASQPIPAFKDGGITGSGVALWGEAQTEVAVTPSGETFLADAPTLTNFDAGTRIYKSVSDYEIAMSKKNEKGFEFDYDKMAKAMPKTSISLNGNGSFSYQKKIHERITSINRRFTI